IRIITAHELGHVKNHDVLRGTLIGALGIAFGVCLLYLVLELPWLQHRAGVSALADPRSIALILAMVAVFTQLATPVELLVSRRIEARADVHALDLAGDPPGQIAMRHRLAVAKPAAPPPCPRPAAPARHAAPPRGCEPRRPRSRSDRVRPLRIPPNAAGADSHCPRLGKDPRREQRLTRSGADPPIGMGGGRC